MLRMKWFDKENIKSLQWASWNEFYRRGGLGFTKKGKLSVDVLRSFVTQGVYLYGATSFAHEKAKPNMLSLSCKELCLSRRRTTQENL